MLPQQGSNLRPLDIVPNNRITVERSNQLSYGGLLTHKFNYMPTKIITLPAGFEPAASRYRS